MKQYRVISGSILVALIALLLYTRLVGINWGLPYPFHPDERNMADVITRLQCDVWTDPVNCFEPGFYPYGQLPLYIGYVLAQGIQVVQRASFEPISFSDAVLALRLQSVFWSIGAGILMLIIGARLLNHRLKKSHLSTFVALCAGMLLITFQTYFIEFAHFGTTESMLMFLYLLIVYLCMRLLENMSISYVALIGFVVGISTGVKVSGAVYVLLPAVLMSYELLLKSKDSYHQRIKLLSRYICVLGVLGLLGMFVASPHYFIHFGDFKATMDFDISLGKGITKIFYTRQFDQTIPFVFQIYTAFPYLFGLIPLSVFLFSLFKLSWKNPNINIVRLSILLYLIPSMSLFIKWGRYMAPILPLMTILVFVGLVELSIRFRKHTFAQVLILIFFASILVRGSAYLAVYTHEDVRLEASKWIYDTLPPTSKILTEFGNVMTLPIADSNTHPNTRQPDFSRAEVNLYNIDSDVAESQKLQTELSSSDYVVIASRRVFANFTCIWPGDSTQALTTKKYYQHGTYPSRCDAKESEFPLVSDFYSQLTDPNQFTLIKTFTSYPRLTLAGKTLMEFPDEHAEEALTVFDHPVVRIYQRK